MSLGVQMDNFAFVIHPLDPRRDAARKYPRLAKVVPASLIHFLSRFWPPLYISHITGIRSQATGNEIEGWFVACPCTARQLLRLPTQAVYTKIIRTGRLARELGARMLGLGAYTAGVGDGGVTIARQLGMPVTTGRSLTVASAIRALEEAASCREESLASAVVAVVGATGSIGLACAEALASKVDQLVLVGRRKARLRQAQDRVGAAGTARVSMGTRLEAIRQCDVVLSATNATQPVILPAYLKRGAIVCDMALPPDVSARVGREREDVLVVEGGVMDVPGEVAFNFDFGLPPGKAYACMAEPMVLALEGRYESYSLGKEIRLEKVDEIGRLAERHGFRLSAIC